MLLTRVRILSRWWSHCASRSAQRRFEQHGRESSIGTRPSAHASSGKVCHSPSKWSIRGYRCRGFSETYAICRRKNSNGTYGNSWTKTGALASIFRVAPLSRATLFQTRDNEWEFVWTFHHMLADGQCVPALIREAFAWYCALGEGRELSLPEPPPFRAFIEWLGNHLSETRAEAEDYWRKTLRRLSGRNSTTGGRRRWSRGNRPRGEVGLPFRTGDFRIECIRPGPSIDNEQPGAGSMGLCARC